MGCIQILWSKTEECRRTCCRLQAKNRLYLVGTRAHRSLWKFVLMKSQFCYANHRFSFWFAASKRSTDGQRWPRNELKWRFRALYLETRKWLQTKESSKVTLKQIELLAKFGKPVRPPEHGLSFLDKRFQPVSLDKAVKQPGKPCDA